MMQIAGYFWQMCLLRAGPESLPSSGFATGFILFLYLPVAITVSSMSRPGEAMGVVLATVFIGVSMQALVTYLLTTFKKQQQRFLATWAALLGTNAFMLIVLLPISQIILNIDEGLLRDFADSAWWICFGWWLAIAGHIYHRSVGISIIQGSVITFLTEIMSILITNQLLPAV